MMQSSNDGDPPIKKAKSYAVPSSEASSSRQPAAIKAHGGHESPRERASESMWMPQSDKLNYLQTRFLEGANPRNIILSLSSSSSPLGRSSRYANLAEMIPSHIGPELLWGFLFEIFSEPAPRQKLLSVNTMEDAVRAIQSAKKIIVVAGAGMSVSCGIPDFRSKDGLYARVAAEFPHLRDPQSIFDSEFFKEDPRPFFRFAKNIFVPMSGGELHYKPSSAHRFLSELDKAGKLLRVYTQNIDGLENAAGISHERVIACHGSFETSTCTECNRKVHSTEIADHINAGTVAYCASTAVDNKSKDCTGVLKPDIVFFGESLPSKFHCQMANDRTQADLIIVLGTSLRVRPVSLIPFAVSASVPQILINRERLRHMNFDVEFLGDCDVVVAHLRKQLGWPQDETVTGDLPSFAFYPPNTYIFGSLTGPSSLHNPQVLTSDESDLLDSDDSEPDDCSKSSSSSSSSKSAPPLIIHTKNEIVKIRPVKTSPDPNRECSSSNKPTTNSDA